MNRKNRGQWTNGQRTPIGAWERALRPNGSSLWLLVLLLVAAGVFLALAFWSALQDARQSSQNQTATQAPAASAASMTPEPEPRTYQISKCTSRNGAATYSDGPCPAGTFTSVMTVRPDTNIIDGMTREARRASVDSNAVAAQAAAQREQLVASNNAESAGLLTAECGRLNTSIAEIDAAARQPRSGYEQDRLKAERTRLRDRQFALRC